MKTKFVQLLCLTGLLCTSNKSNAQYNLVNGAPFEYNVVNEPIFFWDLMRLHFPSFNRQYKYNSNEFRNSNQMLQTKDETGRFVFLQTSVYNPNTQEWVLMDKHEYLRNYESDNRIVNEVQESYRRLTVNDPLSFQKTVNRMYYNEDKNIVELTDLTTDKNGSAISSAQLLSTYDGNLRVADTLIDATSKKVIKYTYNNQGQCIKLKMAPVNKPDSLISHILYSYDAGLLSGIYNMIDGDTAFCKRYVYGNGKLTEVILYASDNQGNLLEESWYKHGYNNEGKLQWVASFMKQGNVWSGSDSMYFNHNNNKIDTSYGYIGAQGGWNPNPIFRLIFDNTTVGLNQYQIQIGFDIQPNPASNLVSIYLHDNSTIKQLEITDLLGKNSYQTNTLTNNQLDVSMLKPGIYLLKIQTGNGFGMKKLVIN